ncbi:Uncharacterised protein [Mycobacteroides abscessus subsp. abscessus]|nr:Uncharacterised protein [Mycobacteroides abscessus subsp. abscessus]
MAIGRGAALPEQATGVGAQAFGFAGQLCRLLLGVQREVLGLSHGVVKTVLVLDQ